MQIKGMAHINFTVRNFEESLPFFKSLFEFFEMRPMIDGDGYYYCVGRRLAMGIQRSSEEYSNVPFDQGRAGLHHCCLSLESRADVDALAEFVRENRGVVVREPGENNWAPGMYSTLFESPDGIRIEANNLPKRR